MSEAIHFEDFQVSTETGFSMEATHSLPDYFKPWHELASKTVELAAAKKMRTETKKLPLLDPSSLTGFKDLRLAHLQLVMITAGYAWEQGPENVAHSIPENVAIPLCQISDKLEVQAGMSYFNILSNWTRIDKQGPYTRQNVQALYMMPGGEQYVGFLSLAVQLEVFFTKVFPALQNLLIAKKEKDEDLAISGLKDLSLWIYECKEMSKDFHVVMQPDTFFRVITSFLRGFNESCGLHDGMLYEGVTERPKRIVINSAASQATIFQIIDTILGIEYSEDKQAFFKKLRSSWCGNHRRFFQAIQERPGNLREMAEKTSNQKLILAYNEAIESLKQFRNYHIQLVTKYTTIPNRKAREEFKIEGPDHFSYLMPLLKTIRDTASSSKLDG